MNEARAQGYDDLVSEALTAPFQGWDFSWLEGRVRHCQIPWSYEDLARAEIAPSTRVLDLNTGGGETLVEILEPFLADESRPIHIAATESWEPNVAIARARLQPLQISLRPHRRSDPLPADDDEFNLVLNRHGACDPAELRRVLAPGGTYLNQSVGKHNDVELNLALGGPPPDYPQETTLDQTVAALQRQGFTIDQADESFADFGFCDVGAVIYHLRAVAWQIPGFSVAAYDEPLRRLHTRILTDGPLIARHHRYLVKASRP